jgi:thiamine-monophosphate kinase
LARNLSDIAAMGGVPRWAVVSLGLTTETRVATVDGIYRGMQAVANRFGVAIVGGDVTRTDGPLFVSVSLVGEVEKQRLKLRSAARAGEMVFITGTLGGSRLGKHLRFTPRIDEARWLARHFPVGAMMDVSDGLGSDLRRLAEASGMGFDVLADAIPVSGAARRLAKADGTTGLEHAWCDGEDFELLFTLPATRADDLLRRWYGKFELSLTPIGVVTAAPNRIRLIGKGGVKLAAGRRGYEHFG